MVHLTIICLGKLKEKYWQEAEKEYLKRLTPFFKTKIIELKEESFNEKSNSDLIKIKEAEKIKNILPKKESFIIALDKKGKNYSSEDFSQLIFSPKQNNNLVFIIGGALGLDESIFKLADLKLSFSAMTFPHQMFRIFLLEQIYRASTIWNNQPYHY